ncbi:MAG: DAK2 domain-containing protein [Bacillota bacterium]
MNQFMKDDFVRSVVCIKNRMEANKDYLIELDSAIGDGDLGLTMLKGFTAGMEAAKMASDTDLGMLFKRTGFAIAKAAPSTMGTLMGTAFIAAGKMLAGLESADASQIGGIFTAMADGISERGKAKEGDKTLLDVLYPVGRAVEALVSDDIALRMKTAAGEAAQSTEKAKSLMNQHGKAAVFREKTIGLLDPGSVAAMLMIEGFAEACGAQR